MKVIVFCRFVFRSPKFWESSGALSQFLRPFSWVYQQASTWRESRIHPEKVKVPVICVGNLVMGGAGKTPTVIAIVKLLQEMGENPHILSRGYGGYFRDAELVSRERHSYLQVGDEPLLLAQVAPTWIGVNRVKTAKFAIEHGATVLVMDDGLQNPSIVKDLNFIVIDSLQGLGNKRVFPAGPLREPIQKGLKRAQAIVLIGKHNPLPKNEKNIFRARLEVSTVPEPQKVIGFAGIGFPQKFKRTLVDLDMDVCEFIPFADHHPYTMTEIQSLRKKAKNKHATLVTTAKDFLRIPPRVRSHIQVIDIELKLEESKQIKGLLEQILSVRTSLKNT